MKKTVLIIGGDDRMIILGKKLAERNHFVYYYGTKLQKELPQGITKTYDYAKEEIIILPVPITQNRHDIMGTGPLSPLSFDELINAISPNTILIGGLFSSQAKMQLLDKNIRHFDYATSKTFACLNAIPTAEGAIELAMKNTNYTLNNSRVCVVGYGRIGKELTKRLLGLGCHVTTTARREEDLEQIRTVNATAIHTDMLAEQPPFQILFNTVPAMVIHDKVLTKQTHDTLIIDLASKPGGVDFGFADKQNISCIHALGLPAKCAPVTAAESILVTINEYLSSVGEEEL